MRGISAGALLATAAASLLIIPLGGSASAAVSAVTSVSNPTPNTYQNVSTTAFFQVTVNSTVLNGEVKALVTGGPDASATRIPCHVVPVLSEPFTATPTSPVCAIPNAGTAGVDAITIFADTNGDNSTIGKPQVAVQATFVGAPNSVTLTGPASVAQNNCAVFTVGAKDAGNRGSISQAIIITGTQTGTAAAPINFTFCSPPMTDSDPSATGVKGTVTTGSQGQTTTFGVRSDSLNPISLRAFVDLNSNGVFDAGEPTATASLTVNPGGADAATSVVVAPTSSSVVAGDTATGTITITNAAGNPLSGVTPVVNVTGANPGSISVSATDATGKTSFSYTATNPGTDTVTAFVNQSTGGTPGHDPTEPQGTATITVSSTPAPALIDVTVKGSAAGGTTKSTADPMAENGIVPVSQGSDVFTATVTDATTHAPRAGVTIKFTTPVQSFNAAATTPAAAVLSSLTAVTDSNGQATVTLTDPAPVNGDAYKLVTTISGTSTTDSAYLMFQASSVAATPVPTTTNTALGSSFPATTGSISLAPLFVTTQVGTTQAYAATVRDQFATRVGAGFNTFYQVSGRNTILPTAGSAAGRTTDANGVSTFSYPDTGSATTPSDPTNPATFDAVKVVANVSGSGVENVGSDPTSTGNRYYTVTAPTAAGIEGGIGAPTEQFSGTSPPYNPKTTDDTASKAIDVTHPNAGQTPTQVFFEVRNADNSSHLPGKAVSISSSGVGSLVGANNATLTSPQTVTVDNTGFASINVLSTATGTQTITGTADGVSKTLTITWTNTGTGRYLRVTPQTASVVKGGSQNYTSKVTDLYGNPVGGQTVNLSLSGPGQFGNGTNAISGQTDGNGNYVVSVTTLDTGTITVTANATGAQFGAAAGTPNSDSAAGKGTDTATLTVTNAAAPSPAMTTLDLSPGSANVNQIVTATARVADSSGATIAGQRVVFIVTGVVSATSGNLVTDNTGRAQYQFSSSSAGTATVKLSVQNSGGVEQFNKTQPVTFSDNTPTLVLRTVSNVHISGSHGRVVLQATVTPAAAGLRVTFYRRSGITGVVVPAGESAVDPNGVATRVINGNTGAIQLIYAVLRPAAGFQQVYSNDVSYKIK